MSNESSYPLGFKIFVAIVIAIVALITILSLIAVPNVLKSIDTGKDKSYDIMVNNIKTGAITMYEEVNSGFSTLYKYDEDGNKTNEKISISSSNSITVNLQTLVSNGFISGTNYKSETNNSYKIIKEPINGNDIGKCTIKISRTVNDNKKVNYTFEGDNEDNCPSTDDYSKGV